LDTIFALSCLLKEEITSLLETHAFPNWRLPPSHFKGWGAPPHALYPIL